MAIALEKILTIGTYEYMQLQNEYERRSRFKFVGIHHSGRYDYQNEEAALQAFANKVPDIALAVTDLQRTWIPNLSSGGSTNFVAEYSGTAIIRKIDELQPYKNI